MSNLPTLPMKPVKRSRSINVRLTPQEWQAVDRLAARHEIAVAHLARHFVLQAVRYYEQKQKEGK